jgi:hypothetical protein
METTDVLVYYVEDLGKIAETDSLSSLLTLRGTCSIDSIPDPNIAHHNHYMSWREIARAVWHY